MHASRIVGLALLVIGIGLLLIGWNATESPLEGLRETFTGRFSERTTWYLLGGAVAAVVGAFMLVFGARGTR